MASVAQWRVWWCLLVSWGFVIVIVVLKWTYMYMYTSTPVTTGSVRIWSDSDYYLSPVSLSKELVIRRVYFDPRRRNGHTNSAVFLFESRRIVNATSFSGCRVGTYITDKFHYRVPTFYTWFQGHQPHAKEQFALIDCYDVPQPRSGDSASLFYTSIMSGLVVEVPSLEPLVVPEGRNHPTTTVVACLATVFVGRHSPDKDRMMYQWLRYQKTIGVDHVHMIIEDSFVRAGGFYEAYSQRAITEGFLSIDFWPVYLNKSQIYKLQSLAFQDCLHRFKGVYDYIVYFDFDDFFVPLKHNTSIKHYLQTWCMGKTATCKFLWREFYPDCGWDPASVGDDGNLTTTVSYKKTVDRPVSKCAHQLKGILDVGAHNAEELLPGYDRIAVPSSEAYVAHLRRGFTPYKKEC